MLPFFRDRSFRNKSNQECFHHFSVRMAGCVLCFCGGYVDSTGYILLKQIFCASVTGNIIKAASVSSKMEVITCIILVSIAYGVGSAFARIFSTYLRSRGICSIPKIGLHIFSLELLFLVLSMFIGYYLWPRIESADDINSWPVVIEGILIALSMGLQVRYRAKIYI